MTVAEDLGEFFDYVWGTERPAGAKITFVYLPVKESDNSERGHWVTYMFEWPRQRAAIVKHVLKWTATPSIDVFYSPALFKVANPKKENVLGSWVLWADFDGNAPHDWSAVEYVPAPTLRIQSSIPGHEHVYWRLEEFLFEPQPPGTSILEERNRSIAYLLKADTSGWDADQILRPPFTMNRKRNVEVTIKDWAE